MVGEACLPSNAYYPRTPDYTLCSGVHVCWSEHSDSSFVYGFMILDYGFGTMTATICYRTFSRPRWLSWMRRPTETRRSGFNPRRGRQHSFVEIDHEIFSTVILSLPLIQEGQLSVSGERMCTILVNRLED